MTETKTKIPPFKTLFSNKWVSLCQFDDPGEHWDGIVFSHETRCDGHIVAVLPFRKVSNYAEGAWIQYLVRAEITPCWKAKPSLSAVTGGVEEDGPVQGALRELREETGYIVDESELIPLGTIHASKSNSATYHLFGVDVGWRDPVVIEGDGDWLDKNAMPTWIPAEDVPFVDDAVVAALFMRLNATKKLLAY